MSLSVDTRSYLEKLKKESQEKFESFLSDLRTKEVELAKVQKQIDDANSKLEKLAGVLTEHLNEVDKNQFIDYLNKPYKLKRVSNKKYEVYIPKWYADAFGFNIGWMVNDNPDETFYTYEVNQYSAWLGDVPAELEEKLDLHGEIEATVSGNTVKFKPEQRSIAERMFKGHITKWDIDHATIKTGHEFDIILKIVNEGRIPYEQIPVDPNDKRQRKLNFKLFDWQLKTRTTFEKTGAVGVFYPTGAGKSFIAMDAMDGLEGPKLIVCPKSLIPQWQYYFERYAPRLLNETELITYELFRARRAEYTQKKYVMVVFDEVHRLPARTFSTLSTVNAKYRMGLSASPHREDGNEGMIFALTGYPIGVNWQEYMKTVKKKYHPVYVHIVRHAQQKMRKLDKLLNKNKKTLIFCDKIELGASAAQKFGVPHVYGQTENRFEILRDNKVCVVSRVGDLGLGRSIGDVQRLIELDFLFGSKQQEIQRTGRLMHSPKAEKHDILMTEKEFNDYGKRIWVLQEKGFHVRIVDSKRE